MSRPTPEGFDGGGRSPGGEQRRAAHTVLSLFENDREEQLAKKKANAPTRGRAANPVAEGPRAVVPTKSPKTPEEAQRELLRLLRSVDGICRALGAPSEASDRELLEGIVRFESPFVALRSMGCDMTTATYGAWLLPLAIKAPIRGPRRRRCPVLRHTHCWACMALVLATALAIAAAVVAARATAGWTMAECNFSMFSNASCAGDTGCFFQVKVQAESSLKIVQKWQPPIKVSYYTGSAVFLGSAFRCCDLSGAFSCCGMYDVEEKRFCDNWPHRGDSGGEPCPLGDWACLFTLDPTSGAVLELQPYDPPLVWPLALGAALLYCALACCAWFPLRHHFARAAALGRAKREEYRAYRRAVSQLAEDMEAEKEAEENLEDALSEVPEEPDWPSPPASEAEAEGDAPEELGWGETSELQGSGHAITAVMNKKPKRSMMTLSAPTPHGIGLQTAPKMSTLRVSALG